MSFLPQIISGGSGLCFVVLLWMLVRYWYEKEYNSAWRPILYLRIRYCKSVYYNQLREFEKGHFYYPLAATSLPSPFYQSGLLPVSKSNRPAFYALVPGLVKKAGFLLGIFVVLSSFHSLSAANITSVQSGTWSNTSTWQGGVIPGAGDNVTIAHSVTIDTEVACANITINNSLTISGTNTLTVNGNWTNSGTFNANNSTVVFSGASSTISGSSATAFYNITINKGIDRSTILEVNSSGGISCNGKFTLTNGLFKLTSGTVNFISVSLS